MKTTRCRNYIFYPGEPVNETPGGIRFGCLGGEVLPPFFGFSQPHLEMPPPKRCVRIAGPNPRPRMGLQECFWICERRQRATLCNCMRVLSVLEGSCGKIEGFTESPDPDRMITVHYKHDRSDGKNKPQTLWIWLMFTIKSICVRQSTGLGVETRGTTPCFCLAVRHGSVASANPGTSQRVNDRRCTSQ